MSPAAKYGGGALHGGRAAIPGLQALLVTWRVLIAYDRDEPDEHRQRAGDAAASDAYTDIALVRVLAGDQWQDPTLTAAGRQLVHAIARPKRWRDSFRTRAASGCLRQGPDCVLALVRVVDEPSAWARPQEPDFHRAGRLPRRCTSAPTLPDAERRE